MFGGKPVIFGLEEKKAFIEWCVNEKGNMESTCRDRANYLMKPLNPKNNHSVKAYRLWFQYIGEEPPSSLKLPRDGVRLDVPSDNEVRMAIRKACQHDTRLCLVYKLLLESGSRLEEILTMLRNHDPNKDRMQNGFYIYELNRQTKTKKSFYIFHTTPVKTRLDLSKDWVGKKARKLGITRARQIRKYVSTKMAALGISESIINFIQGRTPQSILAKHYLNLYALAIQEYPRYIVEIKALLSNSNTG